RWTVDRERADRQRRAEHERTGQVLAEVLRIATATVQRTGAELLDGLSGVPFGDDAWQSAEFLGVAAPGFIRVGRVDPPAGMPLARDIPLALPLLSTAGWAVRAPGEFAQSLLLGVALRVVAATPPLRVRVDWYDPRLCGALGAFGGLLPYTD